MNLSNFDAPSIATATTSNSAYFKVASSSPTFIIIDDQPLEALGLHAILLQLHKDASIFIASSYSKGEELIAEKLIDGRIDLILAYLDLKTDTYIASIEQLHRKYPYICLAVSAPPSMASTPENSNIVLQCLEAGAVGYLPKISPIETIQGAVQSVLKGNIYIPGEMMKPHDSIHIDGQPSYQPIHELGLDSPAQPFAGLVSLSSRQYLQSLTTQAGSAQLGRYGDAKGIAKGIAKGGANVRAIKTGLPVTPQPKATITGYEIGLTGRQVDVLDLILLGLSNKRICRELDLAEGTVKVHVSAVLRALGARTRTEAVVAAGNIGLKSRING
jgi:DNA-binding NarL/FixJ family response regulator